VFLAFDIILFYIFFELTLVPLFFVIGIWGGPQRRYAARKFFIYTLAGSAITLLGVLGVVLVCYQEPHVRELTFSIPRLVHLVNERLQQLDLNPVDFAQDIARWRSVQLWVFLALMAGFAIKVPLVPLHTWLPLAHVEAPTAGSVLLAGVLLKIGAYGFLRLCLPLAPDASLSVGVPLVGTLAVIGIVYGAFCALAQDDIKKLVAYSSVSHLGFCMLGMFALNAAGLSGSLLQMVNHGLSTGALFLIVGMLYHRYHTRMLADYGGMAARLHLLACFMVFFCLTSIGLPGLNGFVGEVLCLMGMYDFPAVAALTPRHALVYVGATGIVLGAWYLLTMLLRVFFGPVKEPGAEHGHHLIMDLNLRELAALVPIAVFCVIIGVYPQPVLNATQKDINLVAHYVQQAQERKETDVQNVRNRSLLVKSRNAGE
jgi:NADH-quinone oxidoreductase subunit M